MKWLLIWLNCEFVSNLSDHLNNCGFPCWTYFWQCPQVLKILSYYLGDNDGRYFEIMAKWPRKNQFVTECCFSIALLLLLWHTCSTCALEIFSFPCELVVLCFVFELSLWSQPVATLTSQKWPECHPNECVSMANSMNYQLGSTNAHGSVMALWTELLNPLFFPFSEVSCLNRWNTGTMQSLIHNDDQTMWVRTIVRLCRKHTVGWEPLQTLALLFRLDSVSYIE